MLYKMLTNKWEHSIFFLCLLLLSLYLNTSFFFIIGKILITTYLPLTKSVVLPVTKVTNKF